MRKITKDNLKVGQCLRYVYGNGLVGYHLITSIKDNYIYMIESIPSDGTIRSSGTYLDRMDISWIPETTLSIFPLNSIKDGQEEAY